MNASGKPVAKPSAALLAEQLGNWFFEDFSPGQTFDLGSASISEAQIIEFAGRYDPQSFHVNPVLARRSPYKGLIASGWHTVSVLTRLWIDTVISRSAGLGSPGLDDIRFFAPVRPGDRLRGHATVTACEPSRRREWRGTMIAVVRAINQDDIVAAHFTARTMIARRDWVEAQVAAGSSS